jgi:hypothetical protein
MKEILYPAILIQKNNHLDFIKYKLGVDINDDLYEYIKNQEILFTGSSNGKNDSHYEMSNLILLSCEDLAIKKIDYIEHGINEVNWLYQKLENSIISDDYLGYINSK